MGGNLAAMPKVLILIMNKETEKNEFDFLFILNYMQTDVALDGFFYHQVLFSGIFSHSLIFLLGGFSLVNVWKTK